MPTAVKEPYFIRSKQFYRTLFHVLLVVSLQNIVNYSVNMIDNLMLGSYGQVQLSAAACVNQIFFLLTGFYHGCSTGFSVLAAQNWGKKNITTINRLGGIVLKLSLIIGAVFFILSAAIPAQLTGIFTSDPAIIAEGVSYLRVIKYTFFPYAISLAFINLLLNVETVGISFRISVVSLIINGGLNYLLIFGNLGFPRLGILGAAYATLTARIVEMIIIVYYVAKKDQKLHFFRSDFYRHHPEILRDYLKVDIPLMIASIAFAIGTPIQGALLGKMSTDAIAANSVTSTFYQYVKVIAQAFTAAAGVTIGITIGKGKLKEVRAGARTIEVICLVLGALLALILFLIRGPLLSLYTLTPEAMELSNRLLLIMCVVMMGMSYEVPILFGVIRNGGDTVFTSKMNVLFMWVIAIPLSFLGVYVWHLRPEWIVVFMQSDQLLKCIPAAIRLRQYDKWIHVLVKEEDETE